MDSINQIIASTLATSTEIKPAAAAERSAKDLEDLMPAFTDYVTSLEMIAEKNSTKTIAFENLVAARAAAIAAGFAADAFGPLPPAPQPAVEAALGPLRAIRNVNNQIIERTEKIIESNTVLYNNMRLRQDELDTAIRKIEADVELRAAAEAFAKLPKEKEPFIAIVCGTVNKITSPPAAGMEPIGVYNIFHDGKNLQRTTDRETVRYNFTWKNGDSLTHTAAKDVKKHGGVYDEFPDVSSITAGPDHICFTWTSNCGLTNLVTRKTAAGSFLEFISGTHVVVRNGETLVFTLDKVDVEY